MFGLPDPKKMKAALEAFEQRLSKFRIAIPSPNAVDYDPKKIWLLEERIRSMEQFIQDLKEAC
jgi:hypothetical protein